MDSWEDAAWDEQPIEVAKDIAKAKVDEDEEGFSEENLEISDDEHVVEGAKPRNDDGKNKLKKKSKKEIEQEKEAQRRAEEEAALAMKAMTPAEIMAEKLRAQKLVEESDNRLTEELFGIAATEQDLNDNEDSAPKTVSIAAVERAKAVDGVYDEDGCLARLAALPLSTPSDFKILAAALGKTLELAQKPIQTREFLKEILRRGTASLTYDDLAEVDNILSVLKNAKVKKTLDKKKKKTGKIFANVQRDELDAVQDRDGSYDHYADELEFM